MSDFITSLVRTYVPIVVGSVLSWVAVNFGVVVPDDLRNEATVALTGLLIATYYTLIRMLAKKWPALESLLGASAQPRYVAGG